MEKAVLYFRIYAAGLPFLMFNNFASGVLRATGDTFRPMIYSIVGGVVNVVLNALFIIVVGWDVQGVALATVISQVEVPTTLTSVPSPTPAPTAPSMPP